MIHAPIKIPTPVINTDIVVNNIRKMKKRLDERDIIFRPHFKTHRSRGIGKFFEREGIERITVSSVRMARYFAEDGWKDITIAFPFNLRELDDLSRFSEDVSIGILISDPQILTSEVLQSSLHRHSFWIELDMGHHRSGIPPNNITEITTIIDFLLTKGLSLKGFLFHDGHTYTTKSEREIREIREQTIEKIHVLKDFLLSHYPQLTFIFSGGDTPSCSRNLPMTGIDEMRPGNFVYYDLQQFYLGSCLLNDIAMAVYCPVVAVYPGDARAVIYGGAVHFSKENFQFQSGQCIYGAVFLPGQTEYLEKDALPDLYLASLSQEHGVIKGNPGLIRALKVGDIVKVYPVHSCLVFSADGFVLTTTGKLLDVMAV